MTVRAVVTADFGKSYLVTAAGGQVYRAQVRGKKRDYACADQVEITVLNQEQAVIESLCPRRNLLYRADGRRTKLLVTNAEQMLFVVAAYPPPNEDLLQRALLAAEYAGIMPIIVGNKTDLSTTAALRAVLDFYAGLGYRLIYLAGRQSAAPLIPLLRGKTSLLVGQSGVGKSTLVNQLMQRNLAKVNEVSSALNSGKHTTTHTILYDLPTGGQLIDSPGLQKFSLNYLNKNNIAQFFPEFKIYYGQCRFQDCAHQDEPGCKLREAVTAGRAAASRLLLLQEILRQNKRGYQRR